MLGRTLTFRGFRNWRRESNLPILLFSGNVFPVLFDYLLDISVVRFTSLNLDNEYRVLLLSQDILVCLVA